MKNAIFLLLSLVLIVRASSPPYPNSQLLVVSFPGASAPYYESTLQKLSYSLDSIIDFFIEYAGRAEEAGDEMLIIYPEGSDHVTSRLSEFPDSTLFLPVPLYATQDLWMRDYPLVTTDRTVKFGYRPEYLSEISRGFVDCQFIRLLKYIGAYGQVPYSEVALDGGNIVETVGKAIATERTIKENPGMTKTMIRAEIEDKLGRKLCWIQDPGPEDTTGHADGLVSFLNENTLLLLKDQDEEYFIQNRDDILQCFPTLNIVPMPSERRTEKETEFASAVGGYVNGVMTQRAIYVPQFNQVGRNYSVEDGEAMALVRQQVGDTKRVLPVNTGKLSPMGGSVRCMTWQVGANTAVAQALRVAAGGSPAGINLNNDDGICTTEVAEEIASGLNANWSEFEQ